MNAPAPIRAAWRSAQLLIAFHKTRKREKRDEPLMWRPKDATAFIPGDPEDREAFIDVKGTGDARDVQIKMHPDKLILRRDESEPGWTGIVADHHEVRVRVGDTWITVRADGSVCRQVEDAEDKAWIEADGAFMRIGSDTEIVVSGDGPQLSRRTECQIDAITADGFVQKKRN